MYYNLLCCLLAILLKISHPYQFCLHLSLVLPSLYWRALPQKSTLQGDPHVILNAALIRMHGVDNIYHAIKNLEKHS